MAETGEKIRQAAERVRHTPLRLFVFTSSALAVWLARDLPGVRGALPDPVDVGNHIGDSFICAGVGNIFGVAASRLHAEDAPEASPRRLRAVAGLTGLAVGAALSAVVETRVGQRFIGDHLWPENEPGTLDFVYDSLAAGTTAYALPRIQSAVSATTELQTQGHMQQGC